MGSNRLGFGDGAILGGLSINRPPATILWTGPGPNSEQRQIPICEFLAAVAFILTETSIISVESPEQCCYPLLAMYGKWCTTICQEFANLGTACQVPSKVAISWLWTGHGQIQKIVLGSCMAGNPEGPNNEESFRKRCWQFRKEVVMRSIWDYGDAIAPNLANPNERGFYDWGVCAETYPFHLLAT